MMNALLLRNSNISVVLLNTPRVMNVHIKNANRNIVPKIPILSLPLTLSHSLGRVSYLYVYSSSL